MIASGDLTTRRWLVLEKVILLSFEARRSVARFPSQKCLSVITGLGESDVCNAVKELIELRMLERWRAKGEYYYRILLRAEGWAVRWRQPDLEKRRQALTTEAMLLALIKGVSQPQHLTSSSETPSYHDALAEVSREHTLASELSNRPSIVKSVKPVITRPIHQAYVPGAFDGSHAVSGGVNQVLLA